MKYYNQAKKYGSKALASTTVLALSATSAFAEVPTEVATELATAKSMGVAIGLAVLVVILAITATKYARRAA